MENVLRLLCGGDVMLGREVAKAMNEAGVDCVTLANNHVLEFALTKDTLKAITVHPVVIDNLQVRPAERPERDEIAHRFQLLCRELGTIVHRHDGALVTVPEDGKSELTP